MASKRLISKIETIRKKVLKFNEDLEAYYQTSGDRELPTIDSTLIGFDPFEPYEIKNLKIGFKVNADGIEIKIGIKKVDGEEVITGWDDNIDNLKDSLAYDRRRLNKAWRIRRSDNPDAELERDEEED